MVHLLTRVKSRLFLQSSRRAMGLLEGEYAALARGRSMDFDDLRQYVAGDEVKDIDWKATARFGGPLVRRYLETRQMPVMLVVDTATAMKAIALSGEPKPELAILAAGVLGYLAVRHGDAVSLMIGEVGGATRYPGVRNEAELEQHLQRIQAAIDSERDAVSRTMLLERAARGSRSRNIIVFVTDDAPMTAEELRAVRSLMARHTLYWIAIADADPFAGDGSRKDVVDVADGWALPSFVRDDAALAQQYRARRAAALAETVNALTAVGARYARITAADTAVTELLSMLQRRSR
jgi:uncharacterized protein (DUF58 family)